jgi:hypothetical protein
MIEMCDVSRTSPAAARAIEIERRLADWKARLPAHSISPGMMAEFDALEEALCEARCHARSEQHDPPKNPQSP